MPKKLPTEPTNADIVAMMTYLIETQAEYHQEYVKRLDSVEELAKYTNGKVRALTLWKARVDAVDEYREKEDGRRVVENAKSVVIKNSAWSDPKLVGAVIGVLGALTALLIVLANVLGK